MLRPVCGINLKTYTANKRSQTYSSMVTISNRLSNKFNLM